MTSVKNLENIIGGCDGGNWHLAVPRVQNGTYLALRSSPAWIDGDVNGNGSNIIARIYPGTQFSVDLANTAYGTGYTYYFANFNGQGGWVNASYLTVLN